jgi:hypothetical protein
MRAYVDQTTPNVGEQLVSRVLDKEESTMQRCKHYFRRTVARKHLSRRWRQTIFSCCGIFLQALPSAPPNVRPNRRVDSFFLVFLKTAGYLSLYEGGCRRS